MFVLNHAYDKTYKLESAETTVEFLSQYINRLMSALVLVCELRVPQATG